MNIPQFSEIGLVIIQFAVPSIEIIPDGLPFFPYENFEERNQRKNQITGRQIISKGPLVCMSPFVQRLCDEDFVIIGAWAQEREISHGRYYYVIRFTLTRWPDLIEQRGPVSRVFFEESSLQFAALRDLAWGYHWRVRAYINPATSPKTHKDRPWFWSINLESCQSSLGRPTKNYLALEDFGGDFIHPRVMSRKQFTER